MDHDQQKQLQAAQASQAAAQSQVTAVDDAKKIMLQEYRMLEDELRSIRSEYSEQDKRQRYKLEQAEDQIQIITEELTVSQMQLARQQASENDLHTSMNELRQSWYSSVSASVLSDF